MTLPLSGVAALAVVCALLAAGAGLVLGAESNGGRATAVTDALGVDSGRARRLGIGLCWSALVGALWAGVGGVVPPSVPVVVVGFFAAVGVVTRVAPDAGPATVRYGVPVAIGVLVAASVLVPLSGTPLPDIGVLGRYTYLATEVAFGAVALGLLVWAGPGALRSATVTVAAVYPLAYVWDWYTLTVGVFEIPLRTGIEFVGIPLEEHLFMVVVPALVLGVHEAVRSLDTK